MTAVRAAVLRLSLLAAAGYLAAHLLAWTLR